MIFALKLTLVLHSGLQSVMLFIFHMFHVHTDLFSLSLCVWNHLQFLSIHVPLSHPISLSKFNVNANRHTLRTKAYARAHTKHCKHDVHTLITQSINPLSFFFLFSTSCVFLLPAFLTSMLSLPHNQRAPRSTHKQGNTHRHEHTR